MTELYAPDVMNVELSAKVRMAPVAGAVKVILLTEPLRSKLPLLSTVNDPVEDPEIVKLSSLDVADEPVSVTANLMPFHVVVTSFQVSVRL